MVMVNFERPDKPCSASAASLDAVAEAADAAEEADGDSLEEASWAAADALAVAEEMEFAVEEERMEAETEAAEAADEAEGDLAMLKDCETESKNRLLSMNFVFFVFGLRGA
jgi:hypothetical protein